MNVLDFNILAGWPGSTETWQYLQNMILQSQDAALLGGNNFIVSGCVVAGGNMGNGKIFVNGELLPFEGGPMQTKIIVVDEPVTRAFFGGAISPYYHNRKAVFGTGPGEVLYSDFRRNDPNNGVLARLDSVEKMLKPLKAYDVAGTPTYGSWLFWGRPAGEIPAGWEAVPDVEWKGKVPVVFDAAQTEFNVVGKIGGAKTFTIAQNNLPSVMTFSMPLVPHTGSGGALGVTDSGSTSSTANITINNPGGGQSISNLQPYKVVLFIRFIG